MKLIFSKNLSTLELKIALLLRYGVWLSGIFLVIGWLWLWGAYGDLLGSFSVYRLVPFHQIFSESLIEKNYAMLCIMVGLCILVLLPIARVLLTTCLFFLQKERVLSLIGLIVFILLILSFILGI